MMHMLPIALLALVPSLAPAQDVPVKRAWPHLASDLASEPRMHFGVFANGVRWAWMDNGEPKQRAYLRLHVDAGSFAERDEERGMAHFLEHMAFNGSKHHPAGTLIEWFQKNGMSFGADTNAHTAFSETVYELDLPQSDEATLAEGLEVLRDYADGLTLDPQEIEAEKGVIDAEERERDNAGMRVLEQTLRLAFSGTRVPLRVPIGLKELRDKFTAESVRAFYTRWYRPENLTLVLVGDLQGKDPEPLFQRAFADMARPDSPLEREPNVGQLDFAHPVYVIREPDLTSISIEIDKLRPWTERPLSRAELVRQLPLQCARQMLNLRFSELRKKDGAPFLSARAADVRPGMLSMGARIAEGESLQISCTVADWKEALATCEQELRRAIEHGFNKSELDETKASLGQSMDRAIAREKTRASDGWLSELLAAVESEHVPSNAATERDVLAPALAALDLDACRKALREAWSGGSLSIGVTTPVDLGPEAEKTIRATYEASVAKPVDARKETELAAWAYPSDASHAGKIAARTHDETLDVHEVRFENGVRLLLKKTDFKERQILTSAVFSDGRKSLDPARHAIGWALQFVFDACGLLAHSTDDLRKLFAGREVFSTLGVFGDQFELNGATSRQDLLPACEYMRARLESPGWREEGPRQLAKMIPLQYESLAHNHQGPLLLEFMRKLYGGDPAGSFPARAEMEAVSLANVRSWIEPKLTERLDFVLVGDLDVEETIGVVARTLGMLPPRKTTDVAVEERKPVELRTGLRERYEIDTEDDSTLVYLALPAVDGRDIAMKRKLGFLGEIVQDRLMKDVRERLGATYSPSASYAASESLPGDGMLVITVMSAPDHVDALVDACLAVADKLSTDGPTAEEVERLKEPARNRIRDQRRTNRYWWTALARVHARADVYDELRTDTTWLDELTVTDLAPLAKQYLKKERASLAIVAPKQKDGDAKTIESAAPKGGG